MNYQNKTKKQKQPPQKKQPNHSHVYSNILVFHLYKETLWANKTVTEHMALQERQFIN